MALLTNFVLLWDCVGLIPVMSWLPMWTGKDKDHVLDPYHSFPQENQSSWRQASGFAPLSIYTEQKDMWNTEKLEPKTSQKPKLWLYFKSFIVQKSLRC